MLLNELTDQQVAGAFIPQDPQQRRQDNAMNPQQLAQQQAKQIAADRESDDPLTKRIVALRAQLAQLIVQQQQQQKADAAKNAQGAPSASTTPTTSTTAPAAAAPGSAPTGA